MSEMTTDDGSAPSFEMLASEAKQLNFDQRQEFLGKLTELERVELFKAAGEETVAEWAQEEQAHLEELIKDQPVEGADFAGESGEAVRVDGLDEPADRAPDASEELIATLVKERIDAQQEAAKWERVATERAAELDAYYKEFGPLPDES